MVIASGTDLVAEAEALYGRVVRDPARYAAAAADLIEAARRRGETEALVVGLRAQAWARHSVLDNQTAKSLLDQAVRLAVRHDLRRRLGDVLVSRSVALQELGRHAAATRDLARAEPLVAPADRADLLLQRAVLAHNAGRAAAAADLYAQVLADPGCPPIIWVKAANNLAIARTQLGDPRAALADLERAATLADELSPLLGAVIANNRAWSTFHAGMFASSLRQFEDAGRRSAAAGIPLGEHYLDYADALVDLRLLDEAAAATRSAADEFDRHGARLMAAEARLRCARLALARGDVPAARADAEAAVRDFRRQRRPAWTARAEVVAVQAAEPDPVVAVRRLRRAAGTLHRLGLTGFAVEAHLAAGRAAVAAGRPAMAREHFAAAGSAATGQPLVVRLRGRLAEALHAELDGAHARVRARCAAGLTDLLRHSSALPSVELRVLAAGHGTELGDLGLRSLLPARGRRAAPARVLAWLERTRAVSLLTTRPAADVDPDVVALRSVEHELRTARRERGAEPRELLARQRLLETRIRRRSWGEEDVTRTDVPVTPQELRGVLGDGRLVEYAAAGDRVIAVVVEPRRTRLVELGSLAGVRRETDALLFAVRRMLQGGRWADQARASADHAAGALTAALVTPLGVPPGAPLVVVPSAPFLRIPWSPLHDGPVSVAPSASVWARSARAVRAGTGDVVLAAGPGLPGAEQEVRDLHALHPGSAALLPPASTVEETVRRIRGAGLAHLACHGRLRSDNPLFSALELSDGPLTVYEMHARGVAPHRVILASCESGVEHGYAGGEVLGFASALLTCGTAGVLASIVPVPDGAATALFTAVHTALRDGAGLAVALHRARGGGAPQDAAAYVAWCGLTAYGAG
jgi:tetratricopeptide (TPR) repeat protein